MKSLLALITVLVLPSLLSAEETPNELFQQGVDFFFAAKPKESVAAFDEVIKLAPQAAPQLGAALD